MNIYEGKESYASENQGSAPFWNLQGSTENFISRNNYKLVSHKDGMSINRILQAPRVNEISANQGLCKGDSLYCQFCHIIMNTEQ